MAQWICTRCGSVFDKPKKYMAGSFVVELVLWLLMIVPGLIYSVWRLTTKAKACPACESREIIPLDTPEGRRIQGRERRSGHRPVAEPSWDRAVRNHLEEGGSRLRWRISLSLAASAKVSQLPSLSVSQGLFEAVGSTHDGTGRHRLRLARADEKNRSVDNALAMAHHACHQSRRLKPCEPLFGRPGVQTAVGVVDGYQSRIHDFWTHGTNGDSCGKGLTRVPTLGITFGGFLPRGALCAGLAERL